MGTLKEADAPGVADDEEKEPAQEDEVAGTEDVEADAEEAGGVPMLEELDEK